MPTNNTLFALFKYAQERPMNAQKKVFAEKVILNFVNNNKICKASNVFEVAFNIFIEKNFAAHKSN